MALDSTRQEAADDGGCKSRTRQISTICSNDEKLEENYDIDDGDVCLPSIKEVLQYTTPKKNDPMLGDSSLDNTIQEDKGMGLGETDELSSEEDSLDPISYKRSSTERDQSSLGTQDSPFILDDDEPEAPNLQTTSVSTSVNLSNYEEWWDVEKGCFVAADPPLEQDALAPTPTQDQPGSHQHFSGTLWDQAELPDNDEAEQCVSVEPVSQSLPTPLGENDGERKNKNISEHAADLSLLLNKQKSVSATVLGPIYDDRGSTEPLQPDNELGLNQSETGYGRSKELGHSSPPHHRDHDEDQPEERQDEETMV
ncbi:uncharacterized protein EAF01_011783 [Botrytis porri]|uniref:uncharacterized protein n=1 Tax=Botrytis porri TaxID=87229 RepID=UPI001902C029|nr:uncharacterized protein EAF01_011783 [Botrytis porri]KAF7882003.1 hypothetical protein EAF01_011783 [Botrytis porri]